jgi:hypothetical protein
MFTRLRQQMNLTFLIITLVFVLGFIIFGLLR